MILAIDLGGTKLRYGVFTSDASIVETDTLSTDIDFLNQLNQLVAKIRKKYPLVAIVSLGVPGPVTAQVMQGSKPLNCPDDIDFAKELEVGSLPLLVCNDLHMAAHYELHCGVGKHLTQFCLVSLSTGIGVAVVNNGVILHGRLEMGHQVILPNVEQPRRCLNHQNCWVSLASGAAIIDQFGSAECQTTEQIFSEVLQADDIAYLRAVNAQAFGNLISAYDPQTIVIMGSMGLHQFDVLIPDASEIEAFTIIRPVPPLPGVRRRVTKVFWVPTIRPCHSFRARQAHRPRGGR